METTHTNRYDIESLRRIIVLSLLCLGMIYSPMAAASPTSLTYQGRILKADGTPLDYAHVSFIFQIKSTTTGCLIYQEQVNNIDFTGKKGVFEVPIGEGVVQFPTTGSFKIIDSFNNSDTLSCGTCTTSGSSVICNSTGSYSPTATDDRSLTVMFHDGTSWNTISPSSVIRSVPFSGFSRTAESAKKLGNNEAADFVLKGVIPSCSIGKFLNYDSTADKFTCEGVAGASGGTVTEVDTGTGLTGGPISTNGTISLANTTVTPGTYGSATQVGVFTVDAQGRLTSASQVTISSVTPGGAAGGDLSGTYPNPSVAGLKGKALNFSSLSIGQILKYSGSDWINVTPSSADLADGTTLIKSSQMPGNCSANETLTFSSPTGLWVCSPITITGSAFGSQAKNLVLASPDGVAGTPTYRALVAADLPASGVTAGTYNSVNVDAHGRVISGSNPTTLSGYGIGDGIQNAGGTPSVQSGTDAGKGTAGTAGRIWIATDTLKIYRDTGTAWALLAQASGTAPGGAAGGDLSGTYPNPTVSGINNKAFNFSSLSGGQFLKYDGVNWVNAAPSSLDLSDSASLIKSSQMPASCSANSTLTFSAPTNNWTCSPISITGTAFGSQTQNLVLAAPDGAPGNPTYRALVAADLPTSGVTAGTYKSVNVDAYGRVLSGSNPTTLTGFGISDGVQNAGGTPSLQSGTDAAKGAAGTAGRLWIATDTQKIYRDTGTAWTLLAQAVGGAPGGSAGGDLSGSYPNPTVAGINNKSFNFSVLSAGQILKYDGNNWINIVPSTADLSDAANIIKSTQLPANCSANQTLTFSAPTGLWTCSTITITGSAFGSQTQNLVLAAPDGVAGNPTYRALVAADLPTSGVTAGSYKSVNVDAYGRVLSGSNPTTLSGFGISDGVQNAGGTPSVQSGPDAGKGTPSTAGRIWIATDTLKIYRDTGAAWTLLAQASGAAPGGAAGGDLSGNFPNPTVAGINNKSFNFSALAAGQFLKYDGGNWVNSIPSSADLSDGTNIIKSTQLPANCSANQTLTFSSPTGLWTCSAIAITGSAFGSQSQNLVLASPNGAPGNPTYRALVAADLPTSGVTAGSYNSVNVDAYGRVTSGSNPTSLSGYGITDGIKNAGGTPSVQSGADAAKGAPGTAGRIWIATDTLKIYRDTGGAWDLLAQASGTAPGGSAGGDLSGSYPTPTVSKINGTALNISSLSAGQILKYSGGNWINATPSSADLSDGGSLIKSSQMPASCSANETLTFSSPTNNWTCSAITITGTAFGSQAQNLVLASPNGSAGAPAYRALATADLPTGGTNGVFINGGNGFGGTASIGTTDNNPLEFKAFGTMYVRLSSSGIINSPGNNATFNMLRLSSNISGVDYGHQFKASFAPAGNPNPGTSSIANYSELVTTGGNNLANANAIANKATASHNQATGTINNLTGSSGLSQNASGGTISNSYGAYNEILNIAAGTITNGFGSYAAVTNQAGGNIGNAYGVRSIVSNSATGSMTAAYGVHTTVTSSGGTIQNGYGVYINSVGGTNKWGLYQSDSTNPNFFNGYVGIGTNTPQQPLVISTTGGSGTTARFTTLESNRSWEITATGNTSYSGIGGGKLVFYDLTGVSPVMTLDTNTRVGIGVTSPDEKLHVEGNIKVTTGVSQCTTTPGSGTACSSDSRLKENIKPVTQALERVAKLRGVEYDWNNRSGIQGEHSMGVIAQEVEKVFPVAVKEDPNSGFKMVNYMALVSPLIEATKELFQRWKSDSEILHSQIQKVQTENERLKKENDLIKAYLCQKEKALMFCK